MDKAQRKAHARELMQEIERKRKETEALIQNHLDVWKGAKAVATRFVRDKSMMTLWIFPAPDNDGYQVSWSGSDGRPLGHEFRPDLRAALASVFGLFVSGQVPPIGTPGEYRLVEYKELKGGEDVHRDTNKGSVEDAPV